MTRFAFAWLAFTAAMEAQIAPELVKPGDRPAASVETAGSAAGGASRQPETTEQAGAKRVFGVLPNYRTVDEPLVYTPITARRKFYIATRDSFDYPLVLLAGASAGVGQLTGQNPSFGQGLPGYGRRLGTVYGDLAIGNMMAEGIYPSLLREDPRYFRRGTGTKKSRMLYAASRIFVARTDAGRWHFNFSEVLGNATSVAIANTYYPDGRTAGANLGRLGTQLGTDAVAQILKEFWPDVRQRLFRPHKTTGTNR